MNVFRRLFEPRLTESARFDRLEEKIRALEDIVRDQGKALKSIELDWEQTYDKMAHLMARITKRRAALEREQAVADGQEPPGATNGRPAGDGPTPALGTHSVLSEARRRHGLLPR